MNTTPTTPLAIEPIPQRVILVNLANLTPQEREWLAAAEREEKLERQLKQEKARI